MRATRAATAALVLALSGSLAAGLAGTAAAAPRDSESTARQLRAIKDLGQLAELTGDLGRAPRGDDASALRRALHERVDRKIRQILADIDEDRPAKTLPATGERGRTNTRAISFTDAAGSFRQSVRHFSGVGDGADSRNEATDALLRGLSTVNMTVMDEVGLFGTSAPKAAVNTTLIDRGTLSSGDLGRFDEAIEAVGDLLEDVNESADGRLSRSESAEHAGDINEALTVLERRASTREDATRLRARADALLKVARTGSTGEVRAEADRLTKESVKLLATLPDSRSLDDLDDLDDLHDTDDPYDSDSYDSDSDDSDSDDVDGTRVARMWTGMLLSPMLR